MESWMIKAPIANRRQRGAYFIGELNLNKLGGGGWLSVPPDKGWFEIFKRSGYVF
jgi:hypothetical protein